MTFQDQDYHLDRYVRSTDLEIEKSKGKKILNEQEVSLKVKE